MEEDQALVRSDYDYLVSGIGDIQSKVNSLRETLKTSITPISGGTTTDICFSEPGYTNGMFRFFSMLCDKFDQELQNVLLVGDGINQMDSQLSSYGETLPLDEMESIKAHNIEQVNYNTYIKHNVGKEIHDTKEELERIEKTNKNIREGRV